MPQNASLIDPPAVSLNAGYATGRHAISSYLHRLLRGIQPGRVDEVLATRGLRGRASGVTVELRPRMPCRGRERRPTRPRG